MSNEKKKTENKKKRIKYSQNFYIYNVRFKPNPQYESIVGNISNLSELHFFILLPSHLDQLQIGIFPHKEFQPIKICQLDNRLTFPDKHQQKTISVLLTMAGNIPFVLNFFFFFNEKIYTYTYFVTIGIYAYQCEKHIAGQLLFGEP